MYYSPQLNQKQSSQHDQANEEPYAECTRMSWKNSLSNCDTYTYLRYVRIYELCKDHPKCRLILSIGNPSSYKTDAVPLRNP